VFTTVFVGLGRCGRRSQQPGDHERGGGRGGGGGAASKRRDLATTQRYIDLAGVAFREEALVAEQGMFGVERAVKTQPAETPETAV
jgi:hypothetical protein